MSPLRCLPLLLLPLLGCRAKPENLLLFWTATVPAPPAHPETGQYGWVLPDRLEREVERVTPRWEGKTLGLRSTPGPKVEILETGDRTVALVSLGEADPAATLRDLPTVDLVIVATAGPVASIQAAVSGPLAILPTVYSAGVPEGSEQVGADRLIGPWINPRFEMGSLVVTWEPTLTLTGRRMVLDREPAPPGTPTAVGTGPAAFAHELLTPSSPGLIEALADRTLQLTGADLVLFNYFSARAPLVGPLTILDIEKALPFHNQVVVLTMPAATVAQVLASNPPTDSSYLVVRGQLPPDRDQVRVATLDYLAGGARGKRPEFMQATVRENTGIFTDFLFYDLLETP